MKTVKSYRHNYSMSTDVNLSWKQLNWWIQKASSLTIFGVHEPPEGSCHPKQSCNPGVWNLRYNETTLSKNVGPSQDGLVSFCTGMIKPIIKLKKETLCVLNIQWKPALF